MVATAVNLKRGYKKKFLDPKTPPKHFTEARAEVWADVIDRCPLELKIEHFDIVAEYCALVHHSREAKVPLKPAESRLMREYAIDLGMMPSGRKSVAPSEEPRNNTNSTSPAEKSEGFARFKTPVKPKPKKK